MKQALIKPESALVLTPNQRHVEQCLAERFRQGGAAVLAAPQIQALSVWVEQLYLENCLLSGKGFGRRLGTVELDLMWEAVLNDLPVHQRRLLAPLARSASRDLQQWQLQVQSDSELWLRFQRWSRLVQQHMQQQRVWGYEDLLQALIEDLESAWKARLPQGIEWRGFIQFTPLEQRLQQALSSHGVLQDIPPQMEPGRAHCRRYQFQDLEQELAAAALWARQKTQAGVAPVAVVINQLEAHLPTVRRVFENVFHASDLLAAGRVAQWRFHLPAASPLAESAAIADALILLQLTLGGLRRQWPITRISRWLLSPHWGVISRSVRSRLELSLRKTGDPHLSLQGLLRHIRRSRDKDSLQPLLNCLESLPGSKGENDWGHRFASWLEHWQWQPLVVSGSAVERTCLGMSKQLERLAFLRPQSASQAFSLLQRLLNTSRLSLHGGAMSPVQLLAPGEVVQQRYAALWAVNFSQANWPGPARPNCLIPASIWPSLPRSTAAAELDHCQRASVAICAAAEEVIVSHGIAESDMEIGPSPIFADLACSQSQMAECSQTAAGRLSTELIPAEGFFTPAQLQQRFQTRRDLTGLPISGGGRESEVEISGGAGLLRDQAASPLAAYLLHRLGARMEPFPALFPDAATRGMLLHSALEQLYQSALDGGNLPEPADIPTAVAAAMARRGVRYRYPSHICDALSQHLMGVLSDWLELERQRPPFSIQSLEKSILNRELGMLISTRVDRIDRQADGRLLLIDYKSGAANPAAWSGERLLEPQLPLYASSVKGVAGVALASLKPGQMGFRGIADGSDKLPPGVADINSDRRGSLAKKYTGWPQLMAAWRQQLQQLAEEIRQGDCSHRLYDQQFLAFSDLHGILRLAHGKRWLLEQVDA